MPNGEELAFDDDFRFHPDPVLHCEIPEDGRYVVEIRDALYRGREDFVYRIALGELPFVTDIFPLGCQAGQETTFVLDGWNLPKTRLTHTNTQRGTGWITPLTELPASNRVPLSVGTVPESMEANPTTIPGVLRK